MAINNNVSSDKQEKCLEMSKFYHAKFQDIPSLSSQTYLEQKDTSKYVLVDVRSSSEQQVSMIPNAIKLHDLESKIKNNLVIIDESTTVVTYCTIGYRSGLEARRLRDEYDLHGRILNLDGIVCYTHACSNNTRDTFNKNFQDDEDHDNTLSKAAPAATTSSEPMFLMEPKTRTSTKKVHVFGNDWDCAAESFESTYFSKPIMTLKGTAVVCKSCFNACFGCLRKQKKY